MNQPIRHLSSQRCTSCGVIIVAVIFLCPHVGTAQIPPAPTKATETTARPKLMVEQRLKDLGTILDGEKVPVSWSLKNEGDADLVIEKAVSSCGCTVVRLKEEEYTLAPGKTLELKAMFDSSGRRDAQSKIITVISNDPVEPELKLELKAIVEPLYEMDPVGLLHFRQIKRGENITKGIEFTPSANRKKVTVKDVAFIEEPSLPYKIEEIQGKTGSGQRLRFSIPNTLALGTLNSVAIVKMDIDGLEREREILIRGEVVGELTWNPRVIDSTRQPSIAGKKLAPLNLTATQSNAFQILKAEAGPLLEVTVDPQKPGSKSEYSVTLSLRLDAPSGPFAAMLKVYTDLLDQPVVEVPVFGIVAAAVQIEPPIIFFRDDGTPAGRKRQIKLMTHPDADLTISNVTCDDPAVKIAVDEDSLERYRHLRMLNAELTGSASARREAKVTLTTDVAGAERVEIPVIIEPKKN